MVEIESCASGGGRIDFGILRRTQRVWLSDSNDALERLKIQHNAAIFLPGAVTGSHVGPRVCHTSGRVLDIRFRAWVAAQRHMGFEMDPRELTEDGGRRSHRGHRLVEGQPRLDVFGRHPAPRQPGPGVIAEQQLAEGGGRFVVFAGKADTSRQIAPRPLQLARLDPEALYRIELVNRADAPGLSRGTPALERGPGHPFGALPDEPRPDPAVVVPRNHVGHRGHPAALMRKRRSAKGCQGRHDVLIHPLQRSTLIHCRSAELDKEP